MHLGILGWRLTLERVGCVMASLAILDLMTLEESLR
jgi:hypothetical protein